MLDILVNLVKATALVSLTSLTVLSPSPEAVSSKIEELKELKENFYNLQLINESIEMTFPHCFLITPPPKECSQIFEIERKWKFIPLLGEKESKK